MVVSRIMYWVARWLEKRGLGSVADTLDRHAAATGDVRAMHEFARRAMQRGEDEQAIAQLEKAVTLKPMDASLRCSLGVAYRNAGQLDAARQAYEKALVLKPDDPRVLSNLGEWCIAKGQSDEAIGWFDKALTLEPDFFDARVNKATALFEQRRFEEARKLAEQLVSDEPERPESHGTLGNLLMHSGQITDAIKHYRRAVELRPGYAEAHFNLGILLGSTVDLMNSIDYLERQIKQRGESVNLLCYLAGAHKAVGHLAKAEEICRRVIDRQPDCLSAHMTLAACISDGGDAQAAHPIYAQIAELSRNQLSLASPVLFELNYLTDLSREEKFLRHKAWADKYAVPLQAVASFDDRDRDPRRKLRIGYVSGDFRSHPVGGLILDVLRNHDRAHYTIYCFSVNMQSDHVTAEIEAAADVWENVPYLSEEELATRIREAEIDVLIDLSGHTGFHRLLVFARRPAPVQATWIGYFHSTGMSSIDYYITDPHTSPFQSGQLFSETPVYLPHSRFCYVAPLYADEVCLRPEGGKGFITFGSFNRLAKLNTQVLDAWAQILLTVPDSRLLLKNAALEDERVCERLIEQFSTRGVDATRLDLEWASPHQEMLAEYREIDIALDPFPFNGGMTTLEALWMGVPVVTISGDSVVSRQTISALANIGLAEELAFPDVDAYVEGAIALANNPARLAELRKDIRSRMAASPLCQAEPFTRDLEALLRRMWTAWCRGEKLEN